MRILLRAAVLVTIFVALAAGAWRLHKSRTHQLFTELVTRVETSDSLVALTFDDGPSSHTDSVLAILASRDARATFFVVGAAIESNPNDARRIVDQGHELGNHSYSHQRLVLRGPSFVRGEISSTDSLIHSVGQVEQPFFRPPYGKRLVVLPWILSRQGRPVVLWDLEPDSYPEIAASPDRIIEQVMDGVRPGSVILLHTETAARVAQRAALGQLIDRLRSEGYRLTTLRQLLSSQGSPPAAHF